MNANDGAENNMQKKLPDNFNYLAVFSVLFFKY